jgi:hypothetical protein
MASLLKTTLHINKSVSKPNKLLNGRDVLSYVEATSGISGHILSLLS